MIRVTVAKLPPRTSRAKLDSMSLRLLLVIAVSMAFRAAAADDPTKRGFDADPTRLALSLDGGFTTETAAAAAAQTWRLATIFDYTNGLLVLKQGDLQNDLLVARGKLDLLGAVSLGRVELAAHLPVALFQKTDFSSLTSVGVVGPFVDPVSSFALGDLRLGAKLPIFDQASFPIGLAAMAEVRLPTGDGKAFMGDGLAARPSVVVTRSFGRVRLDAQAGYLFRKPGQYAQLVVHDGFTYALGGTVDFGKSWKFDPLKAILEVDGMWPRGEDLDTDRYRAPISVRGGIRAHLSPRWSVEAGLRTGLGPVGYGHERWGVFGGIRFTIPPPLPDAPPFVGPILDRDGDGVPDNVDLCPDEPGLPSMDGCPDTDGDGIPDREDKCPKQPGPAQNDGCPLEEGEPVIEIGTSQIMLKDSVHFDTGKDTIKSESFALLDQVAKVINDHPEMKRVRVEGHTDNVGSMSYNKDLSGRRAQSVVKYLIAKGVAAKRLVGQGYGFEQPIASNATALGRAKNRRVAFTIMEEDE